VGGLVVLLLVFQAGIFVGYRRAAFSFGSGENFYRAFGRGPGPMGMPRGNDLFSAHGATGRIISVHLPTLVVEDRDGGEKVVLTNTDTQVRKFRDAAAVTDLKTDDFVVVIGSPDDSAEIVAKFIRILPPPPTLPEPVSASTTTSTYPR
jgi:hypothetical protein